MLLSDGRRQQPPERVGHAGVADHDRRPQDATVERHPHADRAAVLDDDLGDFRPRQDLSAGCLDHGTNRVGNPRRSADRIVAPLEIVTGDHGMDRKTPLARRQPVITALRLSTALSFLF